MNKIYYTIQAFSKKHVALILLIGAFCALTLNSCYYDNFEKLHPTVGLFDKCDTNHVISYSTDISLIMNNSCGVNNSCHGTTNTSGFDYSSWSALDAYFTSKGTNRFIGSITWDNTLHPAVSPMPKGASSKISDCNITQIKNWIAAGHPNN